MKQSSLSSIMLLSALLLSASASAELTDPYQILNRHIDAVGGLETLKSHSASYVEGELDLVGTGLSGTFKKWSHDGNRSRQEVDLGPLHIIEGNNGTDQWSVDHNGKLKIHKDAKTLAQQQVARLMSEYAYLDPASDVFTLSSKGLDTGAAMTCYVVAVANRLTPDTTKMFIDTASFRNVKTIQIGTDGETHTVSSDFREIAGIIVPFAQHQTEFPTKQVTTITLTRYEFDVEIDPALFEPPSDQVADFAFLADGKAENIPFRFLENHIYLPVTVKGKERIWVLDTGAGVTVVEKRFAEELGLEAVGDLKGQGVGSVVEFSFTTLPPLVIADQLHFDEQQAAIFDLHWLFFETMGLEVAGILGYDFLSRVVTRVDYANELISFYHPDSFSYAGPGVVIDAPISQSNGFEIPLTIDDELTGLWNFDLGAGGLSFHYPFAEARGLLNRPGVDQVGFGAGGAVHDRAVKFRTVTFAGFTLPDPIVDVPSEKGEGAFADSYLTGNIGNTLLRHFVIYLDYKRERIIAEPGPDFDRVFPRDNSGLQVKYDQTKTVRVLHVAPGTPAEQSGFLADDEIRSVNGIPVQHFDGIIALRELFKAAPGTTYDIVVRRGGADYTLRVPLRDLYQ